ncbi:MAG: hypothetical protein WKF37_19060 [Bryobacteraceae bacterium]
MRPHRLRMEAIAPPLSYSLPGFGPDGYRDAAVWLQRLGKLGFRRVTFHPTYAVHDDSELLIDGTSTPVIGDAFATARELGFHITLEPHLDWAATLQGGPYEWRRRMRLRPAAQYLDDVLAPLAALRPDMLTLGSELDVSTLEFTREWASLLSRFPGIALGHKLNHDIFDGGDLPELREYVRQLDRIAFSFYPPDGAFEKHGRCLYEKVGAYAIGEEFRFKRYLPALAFRCSDFPNLGRIGDSYRLLRQVPAMVREAFLCHFSYLLERRTLRRSGSDAAGMVRRIDSCNSQTDPAAFCSSRRRWRCQRTRP